MKKFFVAMYDVVEGETAISIFTMMAENDVEVGKFVYEEFLESEQERSNTLFSIWEESEVQDIKIVLANHKLI